MKQITLSFCLLFFASLAILGQAQKPHFTVAADGSGDFTSVQQAIDSVPHLRSNRTVIFIKNGIYKEKLLLPATKTNISFIGEDVTKTVITFDDFAQKKNRFNENIGTSGSASFFLDGNGFYAENITFENSAGPVGQAVAVRIDGDMVVFNNCRFLGFQDTLYPHGEKSRQYYHKCYIEGTVDFIFGWSTCVFDQCDIFCKESGWVTAASTLEETPFGFVFLNCKLTGNKKASHNLGRPWRPFAKVAFIACDLGDVIKPEGWDNWGKPSNETTAQFREYKNTGAGAVVDNRVKWSRQLTPDEMAAYNLKNIFAGWTPVLDGWK